jgi:hypothetical protein
MQHRILSSRIHDSDYSSTGVTDRILQSPETSCTFRSHIKAIEKLSANSEQKEITPRQTNLNVATTQLKSVRKRLVLLRVDCRCEVAATKGSVESV